MARILIAEDEAHILRLMAMWLQRNGHTVLEAGNGEAALEILNSESVDMIISDFHMPLINGFGLVKAAREEMGLDVPILVLSSSCERSRIEKSLESYRVRVYPKPFMPSRLVAEIEEMLSTVQS